MAVIIGIAWAFSAKRKDVDWKRGGHRARLPIGAGAADPLRTTRAMAFEFVGKVFVKVLDFTRIGSTFLFRDLMDVKSFGFIFALQILPTIIFFSALTSVLFYLGVIQKVVYALAWALEQDHEA
jgi:CNT family concentrative nucleoside transporter